MNCLQNVETLKFQTEELRLYLAENTTQNFFKGGVMTKRNQILKCFCNLNACHGCPEGSENNNLFRNLFLLYFRLLHVTVSSLLTREICVYYILHRL